MTKSLALIEDLIVLETERDRQHKAWALANNKGKQALGESQMLFHLKQLRELVAEEGKEIATQYMKLGESFPQIPESPYA
jgi:hypothetical protein